MKESLRETYGKTIAELGERYKNIVVFDADLSKSTMTKYFKEKNPDRFLDFGIAEANMIGSAGGVGLCHYNVFINSFACFITGRYEQIRMSIVYNKSNVKIVGTHAGVGVGEDGFSQQGLEDLALMRTLPGMSIFQPSDAIETKQVVEFLAKFIGYAYLRLPRQKIDTFHKHDYKFNFKKIEILKPIRKINIIATGALTYEAIEASKILEQHGIETGVVNLCVVKPLDMETLIEIAGQSDIIITAEDHNIIGGIGSAVSEILSENFPVKIYRIGLREAFGQSGSKEELYNCFGLSAARIADKILELSAK